MATPYETINKSLTKEFPKLSEDSKYHVTKAMIKMKSDEKININGEDITISDLQFRIAESIETLQSETDSKEQYFAWIDQAEDIISDMNSDGVTAQELETKNNFIESLGQREAELMTCLALYGASKSPKAKERYDFIYLKLQRLRELRSAVKNNTGNEVTNESPQNWLEKAIDRDSKDLAERYALSKNEGRSREWIVKHIQSLRMGQNNMYVSEPPTRVSTPNYQSFEMVRYKGLTR